MQHRDRAGRAELAKRLEGTGCRCHRPRRRGGGGGYTQRPGRSHRHARDDQQRSVRTCFEATLPTLEVLAAPCPLFVPLIEEGLLDDPLTDQHIARYLRPVLDAGIDTLILGCTHYPLLKEAIARQAGPEVRLVDSADNCALAVRDLLDAAGLAAPGGRQGALQVALTDASDRFLPVVERALGLRVGEVGLRRVQGVALAGGL